MIRNQNLSTTYHPQTNGQVEHLHQEMETFLHHYVNHLQDDWEDLLAIAEYQSIILYYRLSKDGLSNLGRNRPMGEDCEKMKHLMSASW